MYNNPSGSLGAGVAGGAALAATGVGLVWVLLAAFAIVAAGCALMRIAPKFKR